MEIQQHDNIIDVYGTLKSIKDATKLNDILDTYDEGESLIIRLHDAYIIPSMLIGALLKKSIEGIDIELQITSDVLYEVLDNLNLIDRFHVKQIK
jgi:hypothetical protein